MGGIEIDPNYGWEAIKEAAQKGEEIPRAPWDVMYEPQTK